MSKMFEPKMELQQVKAMSSLALAHMGDCVFELLIRTRLCLQGGVNNHDLHRDTVALVCAPQQAAFVDRILPMLTQEEQGFYRRGRNAHVHGVPKHATHTQYAKATGLEALFGALYLLGERERLEQLFDCLWEEE